MMSNPDNTLVFPKFYEENMKYVKEDTVTLIEEAKKGFD